MKRHRASCVALTLILLSAACVPARLNRAPAAAEIAGFVAPGFEEVALEFERNFTERGELGAACVVYHRGQKVVDLWGGWRDPQRCRPWTEHTMVMVFSTTKGMAATAAAVADSRGWLDYDARVADYWSEFGQAGKGTITVRQLLDHAAGLAALDAPLRSVDLADPDSLAPILARQRPAWSPGERHGYHAVTLGLYLNELIRRADPQHRTIGRFFQEEIARPLGIRFFIGLPDSVPDSSVAPIVLFSPVRAALRMPARLTRAFLNPRSLYRRSVMLPVDPKPNDRGYQSLELASVNGIGEVRAIARVYGELATGGAALGLTPETFADLVAAPAAPPGGPVDLIFGIPTSYRLGFIRFATRHDSARGRSWLGQPGMGGSLGFADTELGLGFAYAPCRLNTPLIADPRADALQAAAYRCCRRLEPPGCR